MTISTLFNILNSIPQFVDKVAYRAFPKKEAPELPFICYLETNTNNAFADNTVYKKKTSVDVELYTENKDTESEALIEDALSRNMIPWEKTENYIDSEKCFQITYTLEV